MADTRNDLWLQITAESGEIDESLPVDLSIARDLLREHNESAESHEDIRTLIDNLTQEISVIQNEETEEIKEYPTKYDFPVAGDEGVTIYVDVSTGNMYRYNVPVHQYERLAMDVVPENVSLQGVPTAPTAQTGTNTEQIATTAFVQNELSLIRLQNETIPPVYYDNRTKAKLTLLGEHGTVVTNIANGTIENGSTDAVTGHQLWSAQQDMTNMSALAARNIAANAAEIELLKQSHATVVTIDADDNLDVDLDTETETIRAFTLSVKTEGIAEEDNTGIVSGHTLYEAIEDLRSYFQPGDGIDITDGIISVNNPIATREDLENLDSQIHEEIRLDENGHIVLAENTAVQNIEALDTALYSLTEQVEAIPNELQTRFETVSAQIDEINDTLTVNTETLTGLADRNLSNLTEEANLVIRGMINANSLYIINGDHTTATLGADDEGVPIYSINVRATGEIQSGDGRIVTGKTVYRETRINEDGEVVRAANTVAENILALDRVIAGLSLTTIPIAYESAETFPEEGIPGRIYIDTDQNTLYLWDEDEERYTPINGNVISDVLTNEDIGSLFES